MIDLEHSPLFTPVPAAEPGITLYLLSRRVAPVQQSFYFTNDGMSADGRYLWFYCAFPPGGSADQGRTLGVIDFLAGEVRHFPETQFTDASPFVDPATGEATWGMGIHLWRRGPGRDDPVVHVNALPEAMIGSRAVPLIATHLTRSVDGRCFFVDSTIGLQHVFGVLPVAGGEYEEWRRFNRYYNHAQFSPVDPGLVLFAQEMHDDPITGLTFPITDRLWLMRQGRAPWRILREPRWVSHEWWDADGRHVWCVWENECWRVDIDTGDAEKIVFPHRCWHAHSTRDGRCVVCDCNTGTVRGCRSTVHFLNRDTGREVMLADNPERADYAGRSYHIDPHPRFCCGDRYIIFTTTVRGAIDVAIVPTGALIARTA